MLCVKCPRNQHLTESASVWLCAVSSLLNLPRSFSTLTMILSHRVYVTIDYQPLIEKQCPAPFICRFLLPFPLSPHLWVIGTYPWAADGETEAHSTSVICIKFFSCRVAKILSANPKPIVLPCYPIGNRHSENRNNWSGVTLGLVTASFWNHTLHCSTLSAGGFLMPLVGVSKMSSKRFRNPLVPTRLSSPEEENAPWMSRERKNPVIALLPWELKVTVAQIKSKIPVCLPLSAHPLGLNRVSRKQSVFI